jgi:hypothetical protein
VHYRISGSSIVSKMSKCHSKHKISVSFTLIAFNVNEINMFWMRIIESNVTCGIRIPTCQSLKLFYLRHNYFLIFSIRNSNSLYNMETRGWIPSVGNFLNG